MIFKSVFDVSCSYVNCLWMMPIYIVKRDIDGYRKVHSIMAIKQPDKDAQIIGHTKYEGIDAFRLCI